MKILNLVCQEKSDISYTLSKFPDGEVHITLGKLDHKDWVLVKCRITNPEELFILMQVCDVLNRHCLVFNIDIYYLMSARMDRVMDFNRPYSLSLVCDILDRLGATTISVFSPHSSKVFDLIIHTNIIELDVRNNYFDQLIEDSHQMVLPDEGALERYGSLYFDDESFIIFNKVRDLSTGKITSIKCTNPEDIIKDTPLLIIDDLCDAGGTFVGIANELRKVTDNKLYILVFHMVNRKGIENLSQNYDKVFFTNSYKTWDNLPDNVTQIDII